MAATQDLSVAFTKASADAMEVAMRIADRAEQNEKAASERLSSALQALKTAGLITDAQVKTATAQLSNHAQTLDILCNVVEHYNKEAKASEKVARDNLGAGDKSQKQTVKQSNYVGRRRGYDDPPSESDLALRRLIANR
jgi:hypothetical protein